MKYKNICITEGKERKQEIENLFEGIMAGEGKMTHIQKAQKIPNKMNPKRPTQRYIIIKMAKVKDKKGIFLFFLLILT